MENNYPISICFAIVSFFAGQLNAQCAFDASAGQDIYVCDQTPTQVQLNGEVFGDVTETRWYKGAQWLSKNYNTPTVTVNQTAKYVFTAEGPGTENLVVNGDFEQGNSGFSTLYANTPGTWGEFGTYDIMSDPSSIGLPECSGQSPGGGNMFVGTGSPDYNQYAWEQTFAVEPNTRYYVSFWAMSFFTFPSWPSIIGAKFNDENYFYMQVLHDPCRWYKIYGVWDSKNNTTATIRIFKYTCDLPTFAIDDIFFSKLCTIKDTMEIHTGPLKAAVLPVAYTIPCDGSSIMLNGSGSSQSAGLQYNWETDEGLILSGKNTLTPTIGAPGKYTLTVRPEIEIGDCAKSATATVNEPNLQAWILPPLALGCASSEVSLTGNSNQPANSSYQWSAGAGGNIVSGASSRVAKVNKPGEYTLLVTDLPSGCTAAATVVVAQNNTPPSVALQVAPLLGADVDTVTLSATVTPTNTVVLWTTEDGKIISGANTLNPKVTKAGIYTLTVTNPVNGCTSSASVPVLSKSVCGAEVLVMDDQYFCNTFPVVTKLLGIVSGNVLNYYWTPAAGLSSATVLNPTATVNQTTTYTFTARSVDPDVNLILNGDFEQGNRFFKSEYDYSPGDLIQPGLYDVLDNPQKGNPLFPACADHTTGSGLMLAISPTLEEKIIWSQTVPVMPGVDYYFSFWSTHLGSVKPSLRVVIGHDSFLVHPGPNCIWFRASRVVSSGSTLLPIQISKLATPVRTAVALDDIVLNPVCEVKDSVTIHLASVEASAAPTTYFQPCSNFEITLQGSANSSGLPLSYNWSTDVGNIVSGANTLNPLVNAPGTYTLTVTSEDPNYPGCSSTASVIVEENQSPISAWVVAGQALNCVIKQTTLSANSNHGSGLAYKWTAGDGGNFVGSTTGKTVQINAPGTYTVVITDIATGCSTEATYDMPQNTTPPTVAASANPLTCALQQATLSGLGSSTGSNFTYAWTTPDGKILSGKDSIIALTDTVGTYILKVTNLTNLCTAYDTVLVTLNSTSPVPVLLPADTISCLNSNIPLSVDSIAYTGPQLTFAWTAAPGGNIVSGADSLAPVVNAPGWYTLLVTDTLNGCTGRDSVLVAADTSAVIAIANAPQALTCATFQVQLNANGSTPNPNLVYLWTTADGNILSGADTPTPTVDAPGTYTLLLANPGSGCTATDVAVVDQNTTPPPVSVAAPQPFTCLLAQQILQGQNADPAGSYTYQWTASAGGNIVSGETSLAPEVDAAGTYTLLVTNTATGCTAQLAVDVVADVESPGASLSASGNLNCDNSEITLTNTSSTNPAVLNHAWTNPDGSTGNSGADPQWTANAGGEYQLLLTNTQNGCTSTAVITVQQHEAVSLELSEQTNVSCFGASDGALVLTAAGGDGTYTYLWENGETTPTLSGLPAGVYNLTVTDGENCTATISLTVGQPEALLVNASSTNLTAPGANDGTATAAPTGGSIPYAYNWSTGQNESGIDGLSAGLYTVTVTDANGCTAEQTVEVTDSGCTLAGSASGTNPSCNGLADGTATALPSGGAAPLSFAWSSGATGQTAENLAAGAYAVTITDANDCTAIALVTLTDPPVLTLTPVEVVNTDCPNSANGSATVEAGGGTGIVSIEWSDGQEGPVATALVAGTYTATATDENGCASTVEVTIQGFDTEPPVIQAAPVTLPVGPAGSVTLTVQNLGLTASDNCGIKEVLFNPESFNCLQLGTQQVTAVAVDYGGNTSSITFEVTVVDITAPEVVCPADIRRCAENNIVEYVAPVATDNCLMLGGHFDLLEGLPSGATFPQGKTTVTYSYTDFSGNVGYCSFEVTILTPLVIVKDTIKHDVGGQNTGSIQVTVSGGEPGYTYNWQQNGQTIATTEDLTGVGAGVYTLIVTDANGCTRVAGPFEVSDLVRTGTPDWNALIAVYPNPTAGQVFVLLPDALANTEIIITVVDARGRMVQEQRSSRQKQLQLDWSAFAGGLYTILLRTDLGQASYRVALKR